MTKTKSFGMFTEAGNVAVGAIVQYRIAKGQALGHTGDVVFNNIYEDLDRLQAVPAFCEATDTEVREQAWFAILEAIVEKG